MHVIAALLVIDMLRTYTPLTITKNGARTKREEEHEQYNERSSDRILGNKITASTADIIY